MCGQGYDGASNMSSNRIGVPHHTTSSQGYHSAERHNTYQHSTNHVFIVEALKMIGFCRHLESMVICMLTGIQQILASITFFWIHCSFIHSFIHLHDCETATTSPAHGMIVEVATTTVTRTEVWMLDFYWEVATTTSMPRITSRQQHCSNAEATWPQEYFQRNLAILFMATS